jgi:hypothetical protein
MQKKAEAEASDQQETIEIPQPVDLSMYLRFANTSRGINDLPDLVQAELIRRLEEMWSHTKHSSHKYATLTYDPEKYVLQELCIRNLATGGPFWDDQTYSQGGKCEKAADDQCINARHPCAHFSIYYGEYIICLAPLPGALRPGKKWTEIGYWVL